MTNTAVLARTTRIDRPADEVAAYLARPAAAARLATPPQVSRDTPAPLDARAITTRISPDGPAACFLTEEFHAPPGAGQPKTNHPAAARLLARRHAIIRDDIERAAVYGTVRRMRIAIAGASGVIGRALAPFLQAQNHEITPLPRDPASGAFSPGHLEQILRARPADAVINLAGASIAGGGWSQPRRNLIWESRAGATRALVAALACLPRRPFALLNASSTTFYGSRDDEQLDETAPRGAGFLAEVCAGSEHEASAAAGLGMRAACLRFGMVLCPCPARAGGARAAPPLYFGKNLAATLGHGRQWLSWIGIDDAIAAIYHVLLAQTCSGPVNITSPNPVTNAGYAAALARAQGKRNTARIPRWLVRLRHGTDFANETLLASTRALPSRLQASGYTFRHPALDDALGHLFPSDGALATE